MAMSDNSKLVLKFLQSHAETDFTAADVAEETGLPKRTVDGIFTSAIQRKGLGFRQLVEIEKEDGSHDKIKLLKLTDEGSAFDPDAEVAA